MPDVLDAAAWPFRAELGQWLGHSLLGVVVAVPPGLALARLVRRRASPSLIRAGLSVALGAFSHLVFDLVTHGNFLLLWPWYRNDHAFPSWWYYTWGTVPLPVYREPYPFAPHTVVWIALSLLGAVLFVRCLRRTS
jgi:membrane-bound metal-dependent hydrolase YbcI (DUF457 family)